MTTYTYQVAYKLSISTGGGDLEWPWTA